MNAPMDFERARFNMIEQQIRPWDVLDLDVLALLARVKREDFVPQAYQALVFADMETPLLPDPDQAVRNGHCMFAPKMEARMLQDIAPLAHEKVLEVGAGSGYMAALLASRAQHVITLELHPELARMARTNLEKAGIRNVEVREEDGSRGLPSEAPFDVIVLSGSVAEIPHSLLAQLKIGGRLGAVVGDDPMMRATFVRRTGEASYETDQPWDTVAPRLANFPERSRFHF